MTLILCQEPGCDRPGVLYMITDEAGEWPSWYCDTHAYDAGFCTGCGGFWGGISSFEASRTGLCENCEGDLNEDDDDDEIRREYGADVP